MCERINLESPADKKLIDGTLRPEQWVEVKRKEIEKEVKQQIATASHLKPIKSAR
jgi:hypothetical protein